VGDLGGTHSGPNGKPHPRRLLLRLSPSGNRLRRGQLRLLVKDVRITGKKVQLRGSYEALAHTMASGNVDTPEGVPTLGYTWRAPSERIRTASEIPIEVDPTDEDANPAHMKISEKVLHLRRLGMSFSSIADRLGVNAWMAKRAARWGKAQNK
jgi:hypothetical protein